MCNAPESKPRVLIGDRVLVKNQHKGTVKYIGPLDGKKSLGIYVGIHLDEQIGSLHKGVKFEKRYFYCPRGHGMMVKHSDIERIKPPQRKPSLKQNTMFPSFKEIQERRKARSLLDPNQDLGPMYTASSHNSTKRSQTGKKSDQEQHKTKQKQPKDERSSASRSRERDYTREPSEELLSKWGREKFGNDRESETKARTLYKLHAAYQRGLEYREEEEEEGSKQGDNSDTEHAAEQ